MDGLFLCHHWELFRISVYWLVTRRTLKIFEDSFSTDVFENLSIVYQYVLVARINKERKHILIAIPQSCV